jgi:bifunctional non-homologous end joining protein LigD
MGLKEYQSKRKFEKTPEPEPGPGQAHGRLVFVVQKHAARALHYDLRLELEGVLKSWAVPRGPSLDPSVKRLAVMVDDHPLEYKDFEGVIPDENYGAGSVIIWDRGYYRHPSDRRGRESEQLLLDGLRKGDMKFVLHGEKLQGEFALIKTRKDEKTWLLLKKRDAYAAPGDVLEKKSSVVSQKTLEDVALLDPQKSLREKLNQIHLREALEGQGLERAPVAPMPLGVKPMLPTLIKKPFDHPDWIFEMKWDGYRAMAEVREGGVALYSRNGLSFNRKFSPVVDSLKKLRFDAVLDGEIVAVDGRGHPDFQLLQDFQSTGKGHLLYYVFDLLHLEGHDLTGLPLLKRKELLKQILPADPRLMFSDHVAKEGVLFFRAVEEKGLEGIVAKHSRSAYRMGARTRQWLKVKTQLVQEGVIAGFTEPRGSRKSLGALVLGVFDNGELTFIGHAGGGLSAGVLREIREKLDPLIIGGCPFTVKPRTNAPVTWVKPELVCEVAFRGWTGEGMMRHPVFSRLREDKNAREVVREKPRGE